MTEYLAYIVDDEPLQIKALRQKLKLFPEVKVIGSATRMADAIKDIDKQTPDLLFLDIRLMEGTGFDLLNKLKYTGDVIFVSAYDEYAIRAFEINALDYILKPVSKERLDEAIKRVKGEKKKKELPEDITYKTTDRILVIDRSKMLFVMLNSIELISAEMGYSSIMTSDGSKYLITRSIKEWEAMLPPDHFVRIHRSHIINISGIRKISRTSTSSALIYLTCQDEPITLSRTYFKKARLKYR